MSIQLFMIGELLVVVERDGGEDLNPWEGGAMRTPPDVWTIGNAEFVDWLRLRGATA